MFGRILKGLAIAVGAGLATGVVAARSRRREYTAKRISPAVLPEFENVRERLNRVESRIAEVEARPPVSHAESIADLYSQIDGRTKDIDSLNQRSTEQRQEVSSRLGTIEKSLADSTPEFQHVGERLDRFESRVAEVEARPLPVSHAESIADIYSQLDGRTKDIDSLNQRSTEQQQEISSRLGSIEKNLSDSTPAFQHVGERLDRFESRVAEVEARPLAVSHAESIADLYSQLDGRTKDIDSLNQRSTEQQQVISNRIGTIEKNLADSTPEFQHVGERLDRFESRVAEVEARPLPVSHTESIADLYSQLDGRTKDIDSLNQRSTEQQQVISNRIGTIEKNLADSTPEFQHVGERLDRFESRVAEVEARPLAVSHAESIADLYSQLDGRTKDIDSLNQRATEERQGISNRIGTIEKSLTDFTAGIPALIESIIEPRVEDLSLRLRAETQQAVHATLTTFERAIEDKISDRIAIIEKAMIEQSAAIASFRQRVIELDMDIQRWISAVDRLMERTSMGVERAQHSTNTPSFIEAA